MSDNRIKNIEVDKILKFTRTKDYQFKEQLGKPGSFGVTIKVYDPTIDEYFAIKKYAPQKNVDKVQFFQNFKNEIKLMYKVYHPNIVRIYNYHLVEELSTGYIIMEFIDGRTIDEYLHNISYILEEEDCNGITEKIFEGLINAFVHLEENGIVHRDIRERNILITNNYEPKIIDFGFGKVYEKTGDSYNSRQNDINRLGVSKLPEEHKTCKYTSSTDMFYLGELFYRLLNKNGLLKDFSYKEVLMKMMEEKPENRYENFYDLRRNMQRKKFRNILRKSDIKDYYHDIMGPAVKSVNYIRAYGYDFHPVKIFMDKLKHIIENNQFEDEVNGFVFVDAVLRSNFIYNKFYSINYYSLTCFYDWLLTLNEENLEIVYGNIKNRIKTSCDLNSDDLDLPF